MKFQILLQHQMLLSSKSIISDQDSMNMDFKIDVLKRTIIYG